jgi:hypothetical protein
MITKESTQKHLYKYEALTAVTTESDDYAVVGTVEVWDMIKKSLAFKATTKDLVFKIEGYLDPGKTLAAVTITEFTITAGLTHMILIEAMYAYLKISVKPASSGQNGTANVYYFGDRTSHTPPRIAFAYEALAVTNAAAVGMTRATMDSALEAIVTFEDNPVRVRWDGTAPTTSEGHLFQSGNSLTLNNGVNLLNFKAIATGSSAKMKITYSR